MIGLHLCNLCTCTLLCVFQYKSQFVKAITKYFEGWKRLAGDHDRVSKWPLTRWWFSFSERLLQKFFHSNLFFHKPRSLIWFFKKIDISCVCVIAKPQYGRNYILKILFYLWYVILYMWRTYMSVIRKLSKWQKCSICLRLIVFFLFLNSN